MNEIYKNKIKQDKLEDKILAEDNSGVNNQGAFLQVKLNNLFKDVSLNEKKYIKSQKEQIEKLINEGSEDKAQKQYENLLKDKFFLDMKINLIKLNLDLLTKNQNADSGEDTSVNLNEILKSFKF